MTTAWIPVSLERARTHPKYGLGGWTMLLLVGLVLGLFLVWFPRWRTFHEIYGYAIQRAAAQNVTLDQVIEQIQAVPAVANTFNATLIYAIGGDALLLACIGLLLWRNPWFAGCYTAKFMFVAIMDLAFLSLGGGATQLIGVLLGSSIWLVYVWRSRRIRVTTRNEVRSDDPILISERHTLEPRDAAGAALSAGQTSAGARTAAESTPLDQELQNAKSLVFGSSQTAVSTGGEDLRSPSAAPAGMREKEIYGRIADELDAAMHGSDPGPEFQPAWLPVQRTQPKVAQKSHADALSNFPPPELQATDPPRERVEEFIDSSGTHIATSTSGGIGWIVVAFLLLIVITMMLAIVGNHSNGDESPLVRAPTAPASPTSPTSPTSAPTQALPTSFTIDQRLHDYATRYVIPPVQVGDEAALRGVSSGYTILTFEYALTPYGQKKSEAGRLASDEELRGRMSQILCSDPARLELMNAGAHMRAILHRARSPDLESDVIAPSGCN